MDAKREVIFKEVERTPEIEKLIDRGINKLQKLDYRIISIRVILQKAQSRHRNGNPYEMQLEIEVPDRPLIIIKRLSVARKKIPLDTDQVRPGSIHKRGIREESLLTLIQRTFDLAKRELEKVIDKQRGNIKTPSQNTTAVVSKIFREQGYGFLQTPDGEQAYFNKNSVLHSHWDNLKIGTAVRFVPELGEKGLQASTVEPVDIPGAVEAHDTLHDLPVLVQESRRKR